MVIGIRFSSDSRNLLLETYSTENSLIQFVRDNMKVTYYYPLGVELWFGKDYRLYIIYIRCY